MSEARKGVLLVNLGSPDAPSVAAVRRYLREFLMDGRVLDVPWPIRFAIVYFAILPSRPRQSAEAYEKIWRPEGSPLVLAGRELEAELRRRLPWRSNSPCAIRIPPSLTRCGVCGTRA
jgi:protoporphyrin/coproporphyrin ferrochelatase